MTPLPAPDQHKDAAETAAWLPAKLRAEADYFAAEPLKPTPATAEPELARYLNEAADTIDALAAALSSLQARLADQVNLYADAQEFAAAAEARVVELERERDEARTLNEAWRGEAEAHQRVRLAAEASAAHAQQALREIAGVSTDLPHARRLDRDRMREIARAALAGSEGGEQ